MSDVFFDGITCIRAELIEEAQNYVFRRHSRWKRYAGLAAGFLLTVCLGWNFVTVYLGWNFLPGLGSMSGGAETGAFSDNAAPTAESPELVGGADMGDTAEPEEIFEVFTEHCFTADVLEAGEGYLLVVPLPGNEFWTVADRVTVPTDGLAELPQILPGDQIEIVFTGEAASDSVTGVIEITVLHRQK